MTVPTQENQTVEKNTKEDNLVAMRRHYEKQLAEERSARMEAEKVAQEARQRHMPAPDDEDESEPYVDHKKLNKTLAKFGQQAKQETQGEIQKAVQMALAEERKQNWIKNNPDFYDVLQHANKFAEKDPDLAETILEMPDTFERQKLVYKNIKALGIDKPDQKVPSIQEKIDANRRSPYYQPSGVGTAPYAQVGDFSAQGQKQAYDKMQQLKAQLRI
jgi:hypothetical protein